MSDQLPKKNKGRKAIKYRGAKCLNCGTPLDLSDVYCSYCGQLNTTKSLSLKDFFGEFIGSILTYDSRLRYTIKDLLFRPGVLTRNYVQGQRLKYANPFRFFLSVSIIFFLIQGLITTFSSENTVINSEENKDNNNPFMIQRDGTNFNLTSKNSEIITIDSILKKNDIQLDSVPGLANVKNKNVLDSILQDKILSPDEQDSLPPYRYISEAHLDTLDWVNRTVERFVLYHDFYKTTNIKDPVKALDSLNHRQTKYNKWAYQKNKAFDQIRENPTDFANYILGKTPFFVFFFTPFFALFFWLIYSKKKYTYMEHMIFIFHIFSFVFLALLVSLLPDTLFGMEIFGTILLMFIGPFYFYKALRNFYKQNRLITIIKFIFLNTVFFFSASIAAIIFFTITAAMY